MLLAADGRFSHAYLWVTYQSVGGFQAQLHKGALIISERRSELSLSSGVVFPSLRVSFAVKSL